MNKQEIKQQNKKALPKFIGCVIISAMLGFCIGLVQNFITSNEYFNVKTLEYGMMYFSKYVSPILLLVTLVIVSVVTIPQYQKAKRQFEQMQEEEDILFHQIEKSVSKVVAMTGLSLVLGFFFISAMVYYVLKIELLQEFVFVIMGLCSFVALMVVVIIVQQKCVDLTKQMNPEKNGSVYDLKFNEKWLQSCDEAERNMIGQCAFKAYMATSYTCLGLLVALVFLAPLLKLGIIPSLIVSIIWFVNSIVYYKESKKFDHYL